MKIIPSQKLPYLLAGILLAGSVALSACATSSGPTMDPKTETLQRGQKTVFSGVEDASKESEAIEEFVVRARHNPCQCDAPPDEIYIHGRWTRVYLKGDEAVLGALKQAMASAADPVRLDTVLMRGGLPGETRPSERGIAYPVFQVLALE